MSQELERPVWAPSLAPRRPRPESRARAGGSLAAVGPLLAEDREQRGITWEDQFVAIMRAGVQSPEAVGYWLTQSRPVVHPSDLRAVLSTIPLRRTQVAAVTDPVMLVCALWDADLGAWFESQMRARQSAGATISLSQSTRLRWMCGQVWPRTDLLSTVLAEVGMGPQVLLEHARWLTPDLAVSDSSAQFATRLQQARLHAGHSQGVFAELLGVNQSTLSSWERGRTHPSPAMWSRLAGELGMTMDELQVMRPPLALRSGVALPGAGPVGRMLLDARNQAALSEVAAAQISGVSHLLWRSWERGAVLPSTRSYPLLRAAFNLPVDALTEAIRAARFPGQRSPGAWLLARMAALGLSPSGVATGMGVSREQLGRWRRGEVRLAPLHVPALAGLLEVSPDHPMLRAMSVQRGPTEGAVRLRQARLAAGLGRPAASRLLGFSRRQRLTSLESGMEGISPERLAVYLAAFASYTAAGDSVEP